MIKKVFVLVLALLMGLTTFMGCAEKADWEDDGALKILTIGNSFSDDAVEYMWDIATSLGVEEVLVANLFISNTGLDKHLNNAKSNLPLYEYRSNSNGTWRQDNRKKMIDVLTSETWDFISVQQVSSTSGDQSTFDALNEFVEIIQQNVPTAKIVWHMTWAYQSDFDDARFELYNKNQIQMYQAIVDAVQSKVTVNQNITAIIPNGTAIQNARTSLLGDTLTRDGLHLTKTTGRYIAGLTFIQVLTGLDISEVEFVPSGVEDSVKGICIESVKNAILTPYSVTNSIHV